MSFCSQFCIPDTDISACSYIIDRYDSLPGNVVFHHAERFQWHNDNPDYDALPLLQNFRFDNLKKVGYANLRCVWVLGCPAEIRPIKDEAPAKEGEPIHARHVYKAAFQELFPSLEIPEEVGVTCCSQFAVRRETIHLRPRAEYVRFREWLIVSALGDDLSGRVLEYSWHSTFNAHPQLLTNKLTFHRHLWQARSQLSKRRRLLLPELWHV